MFVGCVSAFPQQSPLPSAPPKTITPESVPVVPITEPSESQPSEEETKAPVHESTSIVEPRGTDTKSSEESTPEEQGNGCTAETLFVASPLDIDDISSIVALGNLHPPGHVFPTDHIYFYITRIKGSDRPNVVPLYSPADLTVTVILNTSEHVNAGLTEYSIRLQPCEHITVSLGHVSSLSKEIFGDISSFEAWTLESEYSTGGVRLLLTPQGDSVGIWWSGALGLATFAIDSWQKQTGKSWPYNWRSKESVAREIQIHCIVFDTTRRVTTISFSGW